MPSIFANKELIKQEYIRLFFECCSSFESLSRCIKARYEKAIGLDEFALFFIDEPAINFFVGECNQERLVHFFGEPEHKDTRDNQINLIDRFILDSINFQVITQLIERLLIEYPEYTQDIEQAWQEAIEQEKSKQMPANIVIMSALNKLKKHFYDDLVLPEYKKVQLFSFDKFSLLVNPDVFKNWLDLKEQLLQEQLKSEPILRKSNSAGAMINKTVKPIAMRVGYFLGGLVHTIFDEAKRTALARSQSSSEIGTFEIDDSGVIIDDLKPQNILEQAKDERSDADTPTAQELSSRVF